MRSESWFPGRRTPADEADRVLSEQRRRSRRAVVIEEVASDQQQIDLIRQGQIHDALKNAPAALAVRGLLSGTTAAV